MSRRCVAVFAPSTRCFPQLPFLPQRHPQPFLSPRPFLCVTFLLSRPVPRISLRSCVDFHRAKPPISPPRHIHILLAIFVRSCPPTPHHFHPPHLARHTPFPSQRFLFLTFIVIDRCRALPLSSLSSILSRPAPHRSFPGSETLQPLI